ncbi:hypothetical protein LP419_26185 [Massilia sp. H-1]|nr:hypothetical protein LP419_26185 [Massilia sp. H-1]
MTNLNNFAAACACALFAQAVQAAPYTPASGSAVIERLPRRADPAQQELRALRAQLAARPGDLALATSVARQHIATARRETDPRYFGYAQAALAPWWSQPSTASRPCACCAPRCCKVPTTFRKRCATSTRSSSPNLTIRKPGSRAPPCKPCAATTTRPPPAARACRGSPRS